MDLIHARSERALTAANQQLRGSLGRYLGELTEGLLAVLARIEAYIDFPEEDLPAEDQRQLLADMQGLIAKTKRLLATSHYGEVLRDGMKTVILGLPNSGKSLLLNRLLGKDRALVSAEPGTTRDYLEERIIIGPHSLRLIDTAGINPQPAPLEKLGMEKTMERVQEADLILLVIDSAQPAQTCLEASVEKLRAHDASELVASELRGALDAFGEIGGKIDNERMLNMLFATFCIGK
jgi:tRNA modification GTPase